MPLSEADTREKFVIPKLKEYGWTEENIIREYKIKSDRFYVKGEDYEIIKSPNKFADIVLKVNNIIVGVVEVKREDIPADKGLPQAIDYAKRLDVPIAYTTNGKEIIIYDRRIPKTERVDNFLSPKELYQIYKEWKGLEDKNLSPLEYPYYNDPTKKLRSYQETAIKRVIEAMLKGQKRILLTMATGTGKTFTSFQIVWKLIKSGFISRVLFLTDRIFLRDQAYEAYEPFKGARFKIESGKFNKNRQIYFSTYQTLYTDNFYKQIPEDFFDLIIIDECHRSRYGRWGEIVEHFKDAYHLGMTATPRREDNIDVYEYFGEPVFEYSLAQAIEDGYLVPYKIYKILTNIDIEGLDISQAEEIIYDDEINPENLKDFYLPSEFERTISLPDRTRKMCEKLLNIMNKTDKKAKTIIFCVDTEHAEIVKNTINQLTNNENFAVKIVHEDKNDLEIFRDSESNYPIVATTVDLLSTGVDIPDVKNIVFMRPISSRVLFKQIIGRGSRLANNKGFFRIIDFTNATRLIDEWDIPKPPKLKVEEIPEEPYNKIIKGYVIDKDTKEPIFDARVKIKIGRFEKETYTNKYGYFELKELPSNPLLNIIISKDGYVPLRRKVAPNEENYFFELKPIKKKPKKITVRGIVVEIAEEIEVEVNGTNVSYAEYKRYVKENIVKEIHTLEDLKDVWINDKKRKEFLDKLKEKCIDIDLIRDLEDMDEVDGFDIMAHLVFDVPLLTRNDRVNYFINKHLYKIDKYGRDIRDIVLSMLEKYKRGGIDNLSPKVLLTQDMKRKGALNKLKAKVKNIPQFINEIKSNIYELEIYNHT
ncbi:EcoAI/FtnUII family type I restriction enzme subunit R [Methanocaldococcus fervens]|uniref:Type I site-specific deoxyribonuclease n=1 Tax=Methanocaldococcus fervens (strain DSM 4213 / JCM 15782 / AG86) TaxID=573064 RepID=C7P6A6_METFA|nr:DEAD/DEAH box helicase family protein [Methanocaldococcus fervens]ACV24088.1 Type I site-specific deoxyribonuclease [Methanocaldococcus fervens AG86]